MGMTAFCRGEPAACVRHVEQATALYDPLRHHTHSFSFGQDPAVLCQAIGAVSLWLLGFPDQAVRQSDATIDMSKTLSPTSQAVARHFAAMLHQLRGDPRRTRACAETARAIAIEHGFSFWQAGGNILSGWARAALGEPDGHEQLRRGLFEWQATDSVTYQTYYLGLLAEVLGNHGQVNESLRSLDEALSLVQQTRESLVEPELHRLRGEVYLRADQPSRKERETRAESEFRRAMQLAQSQEATSLELRAATSLARLLRERDPAAAREPLREAFDKFSEGHDTQDLQDAGALLASL